MPDGFMSFLGAFVGSIVTLSGNALTEQSKRKEAARRCRDGLRIQLATLASTASFVASDPFLGGIPRLEEQLRNLATKIVEASLAFSVQEKVTLAHTHGEQTVARLKKLDEAYSRETQGNDLKNLSPAANDLYERLINEAATLAAEFSNAAAALRGAASIWDYIKL